MNRSRIQRMVEELALQIPFKKTIERGDVLLLVEDDGYECRVIFVQALKVAFKTIGDEQCYGAGIRPPSRERISVCS